MQPIVISHRTNRGTAAENTLAGIEAAIADGAHGIEVDVRATRDGELVLMHDATLARTAGDPRFVGEVTAEELARLTARGPRGAPAGPVPLLAQAMAAVAGHAVLVLDLKERQLEDRLAAMLAVAPRALEAWVWTSDPLAGLRAREVLPPSVPIALIARPETVARLGTAGVLDEVRSCRLDGVVFEACHVSGYRADLARAAGLEAYAGCSNTPLGIATAQAAGVAAVCTDFPALAARVISADGRARPLPARRPSPAPATGAPAAVSA